MNNEETKTDDVRGTSTWCRGPCGCGIGRRAPRRNRSIMPRPFRKTPIEFERERLKARLKDIEIEKKEIEETLKQLE